MPSQTFSPNSFQTFGDLLKYLRRREHLTQLELSIIVGYSEAQIGRLEKNQRRPDLTALQALFIPALHLDGDPVLTARFMELAESARQEDAPTPGVAPYKGLLFFDETDADLFFGREALTAHLTDRITGLASDASTRLLAVVGASGSGKSSLVRAGLVVALKLKGWEVRVFTPGANPLKALEMQLEQDQAEVKSDRFLIVADQFEEVFTLCRDESERVAFIQKLIALAQHASHKITLVIALRADFYSHCAQYPALRKAVAAQQEYIGQMTTEELRRAIEEPARYGKWEFEPGLVDVLLQDIGADGAGHPEPGALPLLSHALLATWEHRRGRTFTLDGYRASGGVRGAIAETAESVFTDQLNREGQELARDIFLRLTELGEGTEDTRRRARLNELVRQSQEATQLRAVLNTLAEARLITLNEDSAEVAHEALIREWERLREWLTQDRDGLRLHRHLTESAREWEGRGRDASELYRGARLAQTREWAEANETRLNESERAFLDASIQQEQHEALEREAQRQRELEAAREVAETKSKSEVRLRARNRVITFVGAIAVILAIVAGLFAIRFSQSSEIAQANFIRAEAQRLAGEANNLLKSNGSSELIALLALRSMNIQYSPQGDAALAGAAGLNYPRQNFVGHTDQVTNVAFSYDGKHIVTGSLDGTARWWDVQTGKELQKFIYMFGAISIPVTWAAISPDNQYFLTTGSVSLSSPGITLWQVKTGEEALTFSFGTQGNVVPSVVAFSPDGKHVFTGFTNAVVQVFDAQTGEIVDRYILPTPAQAVLYVSPDGKYAISRTSSAQGTLMLWGLGETISKLQEFTYNAAISGAAQNVAVSPDGKSIVIGYIGGDIVLWDGASGGIVRISKGHSAEAHSIAFSPDGNYVLSGGFDKTARLWDVKTGRELLRLNTSGAVNSVTFSPDGQSILTGCSDGTVQLWDIHPRSELPAFTNENLDTGISLSAVAFSPDGKLLATGGTDGLKLWDVRTGRLQRAFANFGVIKYGVKFSPDGLYLLSGNYTSSITSLWDAQTGEQLRQFLDTTSRYYKYTNLNDVAFSPDGKIVAAGNGNAVNLWEIQTGHGLWGLETTGFITRLAFSPDGKSLLIANTSGEVRQYEMPFGKFIKSFTGAAALNGVAFSPNGKYIATASVDKLAHLWDVELGEEIRQFIGHTDILYSVEFSLDGETIATTSADGTARLWDVETGQELRRFTGHTAGVQNVAFSPNGKYLATVSDDGTARLWDNDYHTTMQYLCLILLRDFTDEERAQYGITDDAPTCP
jgi:WD40 repeat protein/transcriptional regulator with XRE-family HTH domain